MFDKIAMTIIRQGYAFVIALGIAAVSSMLGLW